MKAHDVLDMRGRRRLGGILAQIILISLVMAMFQIPASAAGNACHTSSPVSAVYTVTVCITAPGDGAIVSGVRSVTATATTVVDVQDVVVDDGVAPVTVDVSGQRVVVSSFSRTNHKLSHERSFDGSLTTSVDDGSAVETVVFEFTKPGHVRISVLGGVFGPMSEGEAQALFRTLIQ